jgi:hypothetical protein
MGHATRDVEAFLAELRAQAKAKRKAVVVNPALEELEQRRLMTVSAAVTGLPSSVSEGSTVTATLTPTIDSNHVFNHWRVDWGDGDTETITSNDTATLSHYYVDGSMTASFSADLWADGLSGFSPESNTATTEVFIDDVAPSFGFTASATVDLYDGFTITANGFSDPGDDVATDWILNWGDGFTETVGFGATEYSHDYAAVGDYSVGISVANEDGTFGGGGLMARVAKTEIRSNLNGPLFLSIAAGVATANFQEVNATGAATLVALLTKNLQCVVGTPGSVTVAAAPPTLTGIVVVTFTVTGPPAVPGDVFTVDIYDPAAAGTVDDYSMTIRIVA